MEYLTHCIVASAFFLVVGCNSSNEKGSTATPKQSLNSESILEDTLIRNLKFDIYCLYANTKFAFKTDSAHLIEYNECDLIVDTASRNNDTLKMRIRFYYNGLLVNPSNTNHRGTRMFASLLYDLKRNKIIMYITDENLGFFETSPKSRLYKPLQPDVIKFMQYNQAIIHPWLRKEAIRRGILQP